MTLSLVCKSSVQIALRWRFLAEDELFNLNRQAFRGPAYVHHSLPDKPPEIGHTQIDEARCLYDNWIGFDLKGQKKLEIAIDRWIKSKAYKDCEDQIIDLAIALEALYLPDARESPFKLAVRASWFLGKDREKRKKLFAMFLELYKCRSDVVHGGELKKKGNVTIQEQSVPMYDFITQCQEYCRNSIEEILKQCWKHGKFTKNDFWDNLVLGEESS